MIINIGLLWKQQCLETYTVSGSLGTNLPAIPSYVQLQIHLSNSYIWWTMLENSFLIVHLYMCTYGPILQGRIVPQKLVIFLFFKF